MSRVGVLAQLEPVDERPWRVMDDLGAALGELGWFEATWRRDIWYATLVHFAADIADPAGLVEWVLAHRVLADPMRLPVTALDLVRFHHTSDAATGQTFMRPERWSSHAFGPRRRPPSSTREESRVRGSTHP